MAINDNADVNDPINGNNDLATAMERGGVDVRSGRAKKQEPIYKIVNTDERIAVSRHHGTVLKSRIDQGLKKRQTRYESRWQQAIRYYNADQSSHRTENDDDSAQNISVDERSKTTNSQTDNIVFANTSALVPTIYAKNPDVEITESINENDEYGRVAEKFMNNMLHRRAYPRFNVRDAVRRSIVCCTITNVGYVEVGYTKKADASQAALAELQQLSQQLAEATSTERVEEVEGAISAIEDKIAFLRPEGPWHKCYSPLQVVRDPNNSEESLVNDAWIAIWDLMPTNFLQAVYGTKKNGEQRMLFKPTHVLPANKQSGEGGGDGRNKAEAEIDSYELLTKDSKAADFGYNSDAAYNAAKMTKVWRVWDKTTRRVYMYADNDWTWPIWVWNDPYSLIDFYPLHQLTFYTDPIDGIGNSEVSYYLDQQDALNEIASEFRSARRNAKFNLAYDKNKVAGTEVDAMLDSRNPRALGVDVPDGMKIEDMIHALMPPSIQYADLFNTRGIMESIYRISSVTSAMQGNEFRTNTTNKAIEFYNSSQATRLDEKIDAIENFIADLCWTMFQMCVQFMPADLVERVLGPTRAAEWKQMSPQELQSRVGGLQVVGGSTQKPNTQAKQRMAIEVGQVLGQFAAAAPSTVMIMLRVFERAFDDVIITNEDWDFLKRVVGASVGTTENAVTADRASTDTGTNEPKMMQLIDALPTQAKEALARAMLQGVPIEQALQQIMQALHGAAGAGAGAGAGAQGGNGTQPASAQSPTQPQPRPSTQQTGA